LTKHEWDAKIKADMAGKERIGGKADAVVAHELRQPEWKLKTGDTNKGTLLMSTGWKMTGGVDSETVLQFAWELDPSSSYSTEDSIFTFLFAKDMHTKETEVS